MVSVYSLGGGCMGALDVGKKAPDFSLTGMDGKTFSLNEELARGPVVAVFFKISCPTCQYALPFAERIYQAYRAKGMSIVGISQNNLKDTELFVNAYGLSFPILLDDTKSYPVSNAYGLTNVPTTFWIASDGEIEISSVGWDRADYEKINAKAAEVGAAGLVPVFHVEENVPAFRAG
jgi:peroxiredoxin